MLQFKSIELDLAQSPIVIFLKFFRMALSRLYRPSVEAIIERVYTKVQASTRALETILQRMNLTKKRFCI